MRTVVSFDEELPDPAARRKPVITIRALYVSY
jgi:hypothetical protein